tara:strand:- start:144 stop:548 length:405 start_codon:yes stop_codon:yes gene_type:complete
MVTMDLLVKYIEELTEDTALDEFTMRDVQMKLPGIKHKWTGRLMRTKMSLHDKQNDRYKRVNELANRLVEESPIKLSFPIARQKVENHDSITTIDLSIQELKLVIEFLEKTERTLNSMTFDIKNLTEIMKLELQ